MTSTELALKGTAALVGLAVVPTLWVLGRESIQRWSTKRALAEVDAARAALRDPAADLGELRKLLSRRFRRPAVERAVLHLLRAADPVEVAWGARLFAELGLAERYAELVRSAPKWSERTHAAEVLGLAGIVSAVPALVAALRDRHEDEVSVKVAAATALARLRDPSAIPLLTEELLDVDERSSRTVAEALVAFGPLAVPRLLEVLSDTAHLPARVWAARILGRIGDGAAVGELLARLHDRDDLLRMAAAESLGMIGDKRAVQSLVRATLRDPAPQVRAHAAGALGAIEGERAADVLVAALSDPDHATRLRALEAFETMRIEDTSALEAGLRDANAEVRRRAGLALERVGYLDRVVRRLTSDNLEDRKRAYDAFVELGRVGLVDSIASYVHHASFEVRAVAAKACGELGSERTAPLLVRVLDDDAWPVRAAACDALGRLRHEASASLLVAKLADAEEVVRETAGEALTCLPAAALAPHAAAFAAAYENGTVAMRSHAITLASLAAGPEAEVLIVKATVDPSDIVRLRAVTSLAGRTSRGVVDPLVARLTDASLEVRMAAVSALGSIENDEAFDGLLQALAGALPDVRDRVAEALSRGARERVFARLSELEASTSLDLRLGLAWTLGKMGDARGVAPLTRFLRDLSPKLRASAAGALAKIPSEQGFEALLAVAGDPHGRVRAAVVNALGRSGRNERRTLEALERRAVDPDPFVRNRAVIALARVAGADVEARVLGHARRIDPAAALVALALVGTPAALSEVLGRILEPKALEAVVALLKHEDHEVSAAFFGAVHIDPSFDGAPLPDSPAALSRRYEHVLRTGLDVGGRRLAVRALMRLGGERAIDALADALVGDPDESVRSLAAEALARHVKAESARRALVRGVADPHVDVAVRAIRALEVCRTPDVAAALAARLGAGPPQLAEAVESALATLHRDDPMAFMDWMMGVDVPDLIAPAVRVLARIASPSTLPLLFELVKSRSALLRAAAARAMGAIGVPEALAALEPMLQDPSEDVRVAVLESMALPRDALMRTAAVRRDPSEAVRRAAAMLLAKVESTTAKPVTKALEAMLDDASARVRAAALGSLLALKDRDALLSFVRAWPGASIEARAELRRDPRASALAFDLASRLGASADPAERRAAVTALSAIDAPGECLVPALADPSADVRIAAVYAVAALADGAARARLHELLGDPDPNVRDAVRRSSLRTVG